MRDKVIGSVIKMQTLTMKKQITFSIFIISLITNPSFGQNQYKRGYIITLDNDTILAEVAIRTNSRNYESCLCLIENSKTEYFPDQISEFGYENEKVFTSRINEGSFVEVLVLGEISLFKSANKYHLKKDTIIYDLESVIEEVNADGKVVVREDFRWRGIVAFLISDCINNPYSTISNLNMNEKSLTKIIVRYNDCKGIEYKELKKDKPWLKCGIGGIVGIARSDIKVTHILEQNLYMNDSYSSLNPNLGVLFSLYSPRFSENISLDGEIQFIKSYYSSLVIIERLIVDYHDTYIKISTLSFPVSVNYTIPRKSFNLCFQGGINFDYHLNSETRLLSESVISDYIVYTAPERIAFEVNKGQLGSWLGIGICKSYQKFNAGIAVRYFHMSQINKTEPFFASNSRISISFNYIRK